MQRIMYTAESGQTKSIQAAKVVDSNSEELI